MGIETLDLAELYEQLEVLLSQAGDVRNLAAQNMPVATKNAAHDLYEAIADLLSRVERDLGEV